MPTTLKSILKSHYTPIALFALVAIYLMPVKNGYLLRWCDELSLFEPTSQFFNAAINYPGGMLKYAGAFLTQFMYYPAVGSLMLIALWLLLSYISLKAFKIRLQFISATLLVPAMMLVSVVQLDETWITLNTSGYIFSQTIGYTIAVALFWAYRSIKSPLRPLVAIIIALLYPILGFFAMFAWLICLLWDIISNFKSHKNLTRILLVAALLISIFLPRIYFLYWNGTTADDDYLFLRGLPELFMNMTDILLWLPFIISTGLLLLFAIFTEHTFSPRHTTVCYALASLLLVSSGASAWNAAQKPEGFRAMLLMLKHMDANRWNNVVYVMLHAREQPTRPMRLIYNTAMLQLGVQPKNFPVADYPAQTNPRKALSTVNSGLLLVSTSFYLGQFNDSYRWAMEHSVKFGKRIFYYKYMVRDAIAMGDLALADRYLRIIESTLFHRKWAKHYRTLLNDPELIKSDSEFTNMPESINRKTFM